MTVDKLKNLTLLITDGKHGDCENADNSGYYFVSCKDVHDGIIDYSDARQITEQDFADTHRRTQLQPDDILVTNSGTIGRMALVKDAPETARTTFQKSVAIVKPDTKKIIPAYLYYCLLNRVTDFVNNSNGSAQKNLLLGTMRDFSIQYYEEVEKQETVVSIIKPYDDLIEINQRQIKLLEEAAQRLYKEWFVDLHFPGHENVPVVDGVPEGWFACTLDDVIEFNPKVSLTKERIKQSIPMSALNTQLMVLDSREFIKTTSTSGSKFQNGDTLLARITPCLENGKTGFVCGLESDEGAIGSTEFIVMRSRKLNPYMVYLLSRTDDFRKTAINSMTGSDGRQRAQPDKIRTYPFLLPPQSIIDSFGDIVMHLFKDIQIRNRQNIQLSEARDRLLPKLMSGEIAV